MKFCARSAGTTSGIDAEALMIDSWQAEFKARKSETSIAASRAARARSTPAERGIIVNLARSGKAGSAMHNIASRRGRCSHNVRLEPKAP